MAGEKTSLSAAERKVGKKLPSVGLTAHTWVKSYSTAQNETNDVMEFGMLPAGVKLLGFIYAPSAMAAADLVHKITVGSTDVATGLTGAVLGTPSFIAITPMDITSPTLVKVTSTTAATTPAAGTLYLTPIYASL